MSTFPTTPDGLRRHLERGGRPISDLYWRLLERAGLVRDALDAGDEDDREDCLQALRDRLAEYREAAAEQPQRPAREPSAVTRQGSPGFDAARRLAVLGAAERPEVVAFRRQHIPDGLVKLQVVPELVERWRRQDGKKGTAEVRWGARVRLRVPDPRPNRLPRVQVTVGGIVAELRDATRGLVADLHWSEEGAVGFILTGRAPRMWRGETRASWSPEPAGHRITVTVHPAMTGREVSAIYEEVRGAFPWWPRKGIGEPAGALAVFVAEKNDGRSWAEAAAAWADARPADAFGHWRDFRRQALRAYAAVTGGRKLVWLGKPGPSRRRRRTPSSRPAH